MHPILISLNDTFGKTVTVEHSAFRRYLLEVVKTEFTNNYSDSATAWHFILSVFSRTTNGEENAKDATVLLRTALDTMLLTDNADLRSSATKVIQVIVESLGKYPDAVNR